MTPSATHTSEARADRPVADPRAPAGAAPVVAEGYAFCREVARTRARNFYYGLKLTPEPRRSAVYAIYAWMRQGDDEADAEGEPAVKRARLAQFALRTERILGGAPAQAADGPMWPAFAHAVRTFGVEDADVRAMLRGLEQDLDHAGYETSQSLEAYCRCVASSVGRVCVTIWGLRAGADRARAMDLAERRGIAFQLTNILRDFGEDFDAGRVYLPRKAFAAHGLSSADVRDWTRPRECAAFMAEQAAEARAHYVASEGLEQMIDPACAPTLWAMTRIYSGILEKIEADPRRLAAGPRVRLQSFQKAGIALRAVLKSRRDEW